MYLHKETFREPEVSSVAFHPTKDILAARAHMEWFMARKIPSQERLVEVQPFGKARVADVLYTADGRYVAACFCNLLDKHLATTAVWNAESYHGVGRIDGTVRLLAATPKGSGLALVNHDQSLQLWNVEAQSTEISFAAHPEKVVSGDFSPDGKSFITTSEEGPIKLWSTDSGQLVLDIDHDLTLSQVVFGSGHSAFVAGLDVMSPGSELEYRHYLVPLLKNSTKPTAPSSYDFSE